MKLVFLDASTLDRGDLDFSALQACGDLTCYPVSSPSEISDRVKDAAVVITNKVPIREDLLETHHSIRLIVSAATGVNQIDLEACRNRGISVCNVAGYSTESVAQQVFALLLNLVTSTHRYAAESSQWPGFPIFTSLAYPVMELSGKTLGIVGLGSIGRAVARIAQAFGMKVVAYARDGATSRDDIPRLSADAFFAETDVISLHCPLTPETQDFINAETLSRMKPGAFLINTGRGPLIDESALAEALKRGQLGGAGLDVLSVEPPPPDQVLLDPGIPNLLITPHTAWTSQEARRRLLAGIVTNIQSFQNGDLQNRIV